jgi:hypothetical protein
MSVGRGRRRFAAVGRGPVGAVTRGCHVYLLIMGCLYPFGQARDER